MAEKMKQVKPKKCRVCKESFNPFQTTQVVCGIKCARSHAQATIEKKTRKDTREKKQRLKTYSMKMQELQKVFNKMRRLEELAWFKSMGIEPYCISCQKPLGNDQWCCGHFKTTKARPDLRFDRMNTFLQHNVKCNMHMSGDVKGYELGLVYRFGVDEAARIINYIVQEKTSEKMDDDRVEQLKKEWNQKARELQAELDD